MLLIKMYELTYIVNPASSPEALNDLSQKIRDLIGNNQGLIVSEKLGEKRKLTYPVKKEIFGYFVIVDFVIAPENISLLDKDLKLNKDILRHLILNKEEEKEKPRVKIQRPVRAKKEEKVKIEELEKKIEEIIET